MRVVAGGWRSDGVGKGSCGQVRRSLVDVRKVRVEACGVERGNSVS